MAYPIEVPNNTIKKSGTYTEGITFELDIHNVGTTTEGNLNVASKDDNVTITKLNSRYDSSSKTYITKYRVSTKVSGLPTFSLQDELTISRTGYDTSTIKLDFSLSGGSGYPIELKDKTIKRRGNREELKFSLWLGARNVKSLDLKPASGGKYIKEKTRGQVVVSGGKQLREHHFELAEGYNRATIKDQLNIYENGEMIDHIKLHLVLVEDAPIVPVDINFASRPLSALIVSDPDTPEEERGEVWIPNTSVFDYKDVTRIKFCSIFDSSNLNKYSDKNTDVEVPYRSHYNGDESTLPKFDNLDIGTDEYIGKFIGPDDKKTFAIIIKPRVAGRKCLRIVVESSTKVYNPIKYWYDVTMVGEDQDQTVPEDERSDFQPQIVAYDGLMAETRLHPSLPIRKTEALKQDMPEVKEMLVTDKHDNTVKVVDVDSYGRLIILKPEDVIDMIREKIGDTSKFDPDEEMGDMDTATSVTDWSNVGPVIEEKKP